VALVRGIISRSGKSLGNFWQDIIRNDPLPAAAVAIVVALILVFQGSIQNFSSYLTAHTSPG